ncbi:MAG TPA: hypothetical protein VK821_20000 [Dehalococcoidia bacterium]|nr:hypothetical protein [Dehalococcoidia bacterium]
MSDHWKDEPTPYDNLPEVNSYDEIPEFANESEEAAFWGTHALGPGLLRTMGQVSLADRLKEIGFKGRMPEPPKKPRATKKSR